MFFDIFFIMNIQFKTAVRTAFRERYGMQPVSRGTILKRLDGIYLKTNHMKKYCKMRAMMNFRVSILFFIMFFIRNFITFRTMEAATEADSSSSGDSEESGDLADVDPTLARELARDRGFLWED